MSEAAVSTPAPNAAAPTEADVSLARADAVDAVSTAARDAPPAEKPKISKADRKAQIMRLARGEAAPAPAAPAEAAPAAETPAAESADARAEAIEEETGKAAPAQKSGETDVEYDLRLAKLQRSLRDAQADAVEFKQGADKYSAYEQRKAAAAARGNINEKLAFLKDELGVDFGELTAEVVEFADKIKQQQKYAELPPDVREKLERADKDLSDRQAKEKAEREQAAKMEAFTKHSLKIKEYLETHADEYLVAATDWAAGNVAAQVVDTGDRNVVPMIKQLDAAYRKNLTDALGNDKIVAALLKDPATKAALAKHFASAPAAAPKTNKGPVAASRESDTPARSEGPTTLTNRSTASDNSAPPRSKTRDERKAGLLDAIRRGGINI